MTATLAPMRWVNSITSLLSPTKTTVAAPPAEEQQPQSQSKSSLFENPVADASSPPVESDDVVESRPAPRSLFSNKPSDFLPGSKRKFELDFESPRTAKKSKMEELNTTKRKRETEFETPQKKVKVPYASQTMPPMPRSAMKSRTPLQTPITARKSVSFRGQPTTATKLLRPTFGRSGHYVGSIFADVSPTPDSSSPVTSPDRASNNSDGSSSVRSTSLSPKTKSNTAANTPTARRPLFWDPQDPYWVPTSHNPRPGEFCLPDDLSEYDDPDDPSDSFIDNTLTPQPTTLTGKTPSNPETTRKEHTTDFPESPETPRPSHAQLPSVPTQNTSATNSTKPTTPQVSHSTSSIAGNIFAEVELDKVNKARAAAEKHKPSSVGKHPSKLSQVTQARSRSSSPPASTPPTPASAVDPAFAVQDGHENEHEYDEWAKQLEWPKPGQKLIEEELFKSDMMKEILKTWTTEDDEQSKVFWDREFSRVIDAGRRAEQEGKQLMFV